MKINGMIISYEILQLKIQIICVLANNSKYVMILGCTNEIGAI